MAKSVENKSNGWKIVAIILISFFLFFFVIIPFIIGFFTSFSDVQKGNVALIYIDGVILTERGGGIFATEGTSSRQIVDQINQANENKQIKAIIFQINSPGGSGVASDEIAQAIKSTKKPTVSFIREVGASGAYWVASATDYIFANRMSTVGSIGVIGSYLEISGLLDDYNITYERFVAGDSKDFGSPFRQSTLEEQERFQAYLDTLHDIFILEVAENRKLEYDYVKSIADGFVYPGVQAKEIYLVDGIGGKNEAIEYVEFLINEKVQIVDMRPKKTFLDVLSSFSFNGLKGIGYGIGESLKQTRSNDYFMLR